MNNILNLEIKYEEVLVRMGANKYKTKIDEKTKTAVLDCIELAKKIIRPKYAVCFAAKQMEKGKLLLGDFEIKSVDILKLLKNSKTVCGIVATIGSPIDEKIISLSEKEKNVALSYIYDSIGSVAVEELTDNICNDIKMKRGNSTLRFSPGYGDWGIESQKPFLKWLGAEKIGVTLSQSCQMLPMKSVSALFGLEN